MLKSKIVLEKNRSCSDKVFTLSSILRNRKLMGNLSLLLIWMQKKLLTELIVTLLYKLLQNEIYGHLNENVKTIYSEYVFSKCK